MLPDEEPPYQPGESAGDFAPAAEPLTLGLPSQRAEALRRALAAHARGVRPMAIELRALLLEASETARRRGLSAERLLVEFKLLWYSLPEVRALRPTQQAEALGELVTLCIQAYFDVGA